MWLVVFTKRLCGDVRSVKGKLKNGLLACLTKSDPLVV